MPGQRANLWRERPCVDCNNDTQCGDGEYCNDGTSPHPCNPGEAACLGNAIQIGADGTGYYLLPWEGDLSCLNGQCLKRNAPRVRWNAFNTRSRSVRRAVRSSSRSALPTRNAFGACAPMRQRSVIFDIGFHNAIAAKKEWPNYCSGEKQKSAQPWPVCEDDQSPFTLQGF